MNSKQVKAGAGHLSARRYRRSGYIDVLRVLEHPENWVTEGGDVMTAQPGDRMITDGVRTWSIKPEAFEQTYRHISGDRYERAGQVWARPARPGEQVASQEGNQIAVANQWHVTDDAGNTWLVPDEVFLSNYRPQD